MAASCCKSPPSKNLKPVVEHNFDTVASEVIYRGKIVALRVDEVRMPGGNTAQREIVEHFGAVGVVAIDSGDNIILVYQYRHPLGRRLWELPAGLLDVCGEPPHLTAARELREEAGLEAKQWRVLVDLDLAPGCSDESVRVYLATGLTRVQRPESHDEEADMTLRWFALADAVRMVFAGEIINSVAVSGILAARAWTGTGAGTGAGAGAGGQPLRPVTADWQDKPSRFAARRGWR